MYKTIGLSNNVDMHFRPPSDGGLMIPQEQVGHVFVKRLVYQKVKLTFL